MKVLVTGATGFLGKIILAGLPHGCIKYSLARNSGSDIVCNLALEIPVLESVETVIHAAGKAHTVPSNDEQAAEFWSVNYEGTCNLLRALERVPRLPKCFVFISTVAVYGLETGENIDETAPLNGSTPYAQSKIAAEQAVSDWCNSHQVNCVILRLPLVVGKDAPGNLGKMRSAIQKRRYVRIKGNPARKSVVSAEDVARIIPSLIDKQGIFNLTDGRHPLFSQIEDSISRETGRPVRVSLPVGLLKFVAKVGDYIPMFPLDTVRLQKMTSTLTFSDAKARVELGWNPQPAFHY
jgi:nucleoside-diphosphate-sugar epimerase